MSTLSRLSATSCCAAAALVMLSPAAQAQSRQVRPVVSTPPAASVGAAQAAPNPAGLRAPFPAGITSGSGAAVSTDPVATNAAVTPSAVAATDPNPGNDTPGTDTPPATDTPATSVLGGAPGYGVARGPGRSTGFGSGGYNAVDVARSFLQADGNRDGELSRSEAARLAILPMGFEEMDRNFDGVVSRSEYEDSLR